MICFTHRVNNSLYRHQALQWFAETGVHMKLFGRGWDNHPTLSKFACGPADNQHQLAAVYRASNINLQVTPFGAAHQRLFDGLAAGGFFLMRRTHGDRFDTILRELWNWCVQHDARDDAALLARGDEFVHQTLSELAAIEGKSLLGRGYDFVSEVAVTAEEGFIRSAGTIWPEFDRVSFDSRAEVQQLVTRYLPDAETRRLITHSMRRRVLDSLTYRAVSQRMLDMIADRFAASSASLAA